MPRWPSGFHYSDPTDERLAPSESASSHLRKAKAKAKATEEAGPSAKGRRDGKGSAELSVIKGDKFAKAKAKGKGAKGNKEGKGKGAKGNKEGQAEGAKEGQEKGAKGNKEGQEKGAKGNKEGQVKGAKGKGAKGKAKGKGKKGKAINNEGQMASAKAEVEDVTQPPKAASKKAPKSSRGTRRGEKAERYSSSYSCIAQLPVDFLVVLSSLTHHVCFFCVCVCLSNQTFEVLRILLMQFRLSFIMPQGYAFDGLVERNFGVTLYPDLSSAYLQCWQPWYFLRLDLFAVWPPAKWPIAIVTPFNKCSESSWSNKL